MPDTLTFFKLTSGSIKRFRFIYQFQFLPFLLCFCECRIVGISLVDGLANYGTSPFAYRCAAAETGEANRLEHGRW